MCVERIVTRRLTDREVRIDDDSRLWSWHGIDTTNSNCNINYNFVVSLSIVKLIQHGAHLTGTSHVILSESVLPCRQRTFRGQPEWW